MALQGPAPAIGLLSRRSQLSQQPVHSGSVQDSENEKCPPDKPPHRRLRVEDKALTTIDAELESLRSWVREELAEEAQRIDRRLTVMSYEGALRSDAQAMERRVDAAIRGVENTTNTLQESVTSLQAQVSELLRFRATYERLLADLEPELPRRIESLCHKRQEMEAILNTIRDSKRVQSSQKSESILVHEQTASSPTASRPGTGTPAARQSAHVRERSRLYSPTIIRVAQLYRRIDKQVKAGKRGGENGVDEFLRRLPREVSSWFQHELWKTFPGHVKKVCQPRISRRHCIVPINLTWERISKCVRQSDWTWLD